VDAVITDPPYGICLKKGGQWFKKSDFIIGDENIYSARSIIEFFKDTPTAMFFSPYKMIDADWRSVLVWNKGAHVGIGGDRETCWKRDFELIGVRKNKPLNGNRDSAVLNFRALLPPPTGHVAEKPLDLMIYLVKRLTNEGDTILDPFAGSGTTLVACVKTGRKGIGIELDKGYFDIACKRVHDAQQQMRLF
jgi:DNA modification methylase